MRFLHLALCICFSSMVAAADTGDLRIADTEDRDLSLETKCMLITGGVRKVLTPEPAGREAPFSTDKSFLRFRNLPTGTVRLRVEKQLHEPLEVEVELPDGKSVFRAITLKATAANQLKGKVTDDKKRAIEGAVVEVDDVELGVTDRSGKFDLEGAFRKSTSAAVVIRAEGYELSSSTILAEDARKDQKLVLEKATRIYGKTKGLRVTNAKVIAQWGKGRDGRPLSAEGNCSGDGTYSVTIRSSRWSDPFTGHEVDITFNYAGLEAKGRTKTVKKGEWATLDLEVSTKGCGKLSGIVKGVDGSPLPDVVVRAWQTGYGSELEAKTDKNGKYVFEVIPAAEYWMKINAQANRDYPTNTGRTATVYPDEETAYDFDYTGRGVARCRFTVDGQLIYSAIIEGSAEQFVPYTGVKYEGWMELYGFRTATYNFRFSGGAGPVHSVKLDAAETPFVVDVALNKASVSGRVKFEDPALEANPDPKTWKIELYERYFVEKSVEVKGDGTYEFKDVTPGDYHIAASVPGFYSEWYSLKVTGGEQQEIILKRAGGVKATFDFGGLPIQTLSTIFSLSERSGAYRPIPRPMVTFEDGKATLVSDMLPPGEYRVHCNQLFTKWKKEDDWKPLRRTEDQSAMVTAGSIAEVSFKLELAGVIQIEGLPGQLSLDDVWLEDTKGNKLKSVDDYEHTQGGGDGSTSVSLASLRTGTYVLVIKKSGYKEYRKELKVTAGETIELEISLEKA